MLQVSLFGKPMLCRGQTVLSDQMSGKLQKLFCYLLLYRNQPHSREVLAHLFWGEHSTERSKKYLRQTVWQLTQTLKNCAQEPADDLLQIEPEWIQLNRHARYQLDVAAFEAVFENNHGIPGAQLHDADVTAIKSALQLYSGELLAGWCEEWCLYERERFHHMFLTFIHKMMQYCDLHAIFDEGIQYGAQILRYDHAHERTHRLLMRLYYRSGDRTSALRQYEQCVQILKDELNVAPSSQTTALYQKICVGQLAPLSPQTVVTPPRPLPTQPLPLEEDVLLPQLLHNLEQYQITLNQLQRQIQEDRRRIDKILSQRRQIDA